MYKIQLGDEVRDKVTGFTGVAIARVEYINGCIQFCVLPKTREDGKMPDSAYIDDARLESLGAGVKITKDGDGGLMDNTPPSSYQG